MLIYGYYVDLRIYCLNGSLVKGLACSPRDGVNNRAAGEEALRVACIVKLSHVCLAEPSSYPLPQPLPVLCGPGVFLNLSELQFPHQGQRDNNAHVLVHTAMFK